MATPVITVPTWWPADRRIRHLLQDEWGVVVIDETGIAHRGPEYAERFKTLEAATKGQSGWMALGDGGFRTIRPVGAKEGFLESFASQLKQSVDKAGEIGLGLLQIAAFGAGVAVVVYAAPKIPWTKLLPKHTGSEKTV